MSDRRATENLLESFETHAVEGIRAAIDAGADPIAPIRGKTPMDRLREVLAEAPDERDRTFHMECASTSLRGVSALHVCGEYNGVACARALLDFGMDVDVRLEALLWGAGFEWETVVFDVTPISCAQCGLYPQFHRREQDVYANVDYLYRHRYGSGIQLRNVPNQYVDNDFDLGAARRGQASE